MERETTPVMARRQLVSDAVTKELSRPYRAPLATFLVLAAAGRADRQAAEDAEAEQRDLVSGVSI